MRSLTTTRNCIRAAFCLYNRTEQMLRADGTDVLDLFHAVGSAQAIGRLAAEQDGGSALSHTLAVVAETLRSYAQLVLGQQLASDYQVVFRSDDLVTALRESCALQLEDVTYAASAWLMTLPPEEEAPHAA